MGAVAGEVLADRELEPPSAPSRARPRSASPPPARRRSPDQQHEPTKTTSSTSGNDPHGAGGPRRRRGAWVARCRRLLRRDRRRAGQARTALVAFLSSGGRRPSANGQPEESFTRHQPISIPRMPQRGRECQWRQTGSPMFSAETLTQRSPAADRRSSTRAGRGSPPPPHPVGGGALPEHREASPRARRGPAPDRQSRARAARPRPPPPSRFPGAETPTRTARRAAARGRRSGGGGRRGLRRSVSASGRSLTEEGCVEEPLPALDNRRLDLEQFVGAGGPPFGVDDPRILGPRRSRLASPAPRGSSPQARLGLGREPLPASIVVLLGLRPSNPTTNGAPDLASCA